MELKKNWEYPKYLLRVISLCHCDRSGRDRSPPAVAQCCKTPPEWELFRSRLLFLLTWSSICVRLFTQFARDYFHAKWPPLWRKRWWRHGEHVTPARCPWAVFSFMETRWSHVAGTRWTSTGTPPDMPSSTWKQNYKKHWYFANQQLQFFIRS